MDSSLILSILSLIVAILAIPFSYFISVRQIRISLKEQELHQNHLARVRVADALEEFYLVFYEACRLIAHIERKDLNIRIKEIDPFLPQIDKMVKDTGVLDRLASAIDFLLSINGLSDLTDTMGIDSRLKSIRNQISLSSNSNRYVSLGVLGANQGPDILPVLRSPYKK